MNCPECKQKMKKYGEDDDWRFDELYYCYNEDCKIKMINVAYKVFK